MLAALRGPLRRGRCRRLEDVKGPSSPSGLGVVARGGHVARSLCIELLSEAVGEAVTTVALGTVLNTGLGETLGSAGRCAELNGHGAGRRGEARESASRAVLEAAQLTPGGWGRT